MIELAPGYLRFVLGWTCWTPLLPSLSLMDCIFWNVSKKELAYFCWDWCGFLVVMLIFWFRGIVPKVEFFKSDVPLFKRKLRLEFCRYVRFILS